MQKRRSTLSDQNFERTVPICRDYREKGVKLLIRATRQAQESSTPYDRSKPAGSEALAAELGGLDVTGSNQSVADLKRLVDGAMARWGHLDAVVNSAGHGLKAPILEISHEDWPLGMDVYLLNVV